MPDMKMSETIAGANTGDTLMALPTMDMILTLEKAAEIAPRFMSALRTLMIHVTYPSDWHIEGGKACLSAPGAERIAQAVGGFSWAQEGDPLRSNLESADGYMWTYTMNVTWRMSGTQRARTVHAQGHASTRDKFLGKKGGEFRDPADINEADIKRWARHVAIGEGIKQLLGLRGLPESELPDFAGGRKPKSVDRVKPQGNATDDNLMRRQITDMLLALCDGDKDAAVAALENTTKFTVTSGKDEGKVVAGITKTSSLSGKRLKFIFEKVSKEHDSTMGGGQ